MPKVRAACGGKIGQPATIPIDVALKLLEGVYENLIFDDPEQDERKAHLAVLEHLSKLAINEGNRGKVCLMTAADRDIARMREGGRFSNAPDTKQQADMANALAKDIPVLMLLRQNGSEDKGWRGLPFWWPILVVPQNAVASVFAAETPSDDPGIPEVPGVNAEMV